MRKVNLDQLTPFITADGSTIRELEHTERQSLAEATVQPGGETAEHYHPKTEELYYFTGGSGRMRLGDEETGVTTGDCVTIPPGTPHKLWNPSRERPLTLLCCCVPAYDHADTVLTGR
jgi:mannose-6-phosphate isomerase-like protein (cupin superfamily)